MVVNKALIRVSNLSPRKSLYPKDLMVAVIHSKSAVNGANEPKGERKDSPFQLLVIAASTGGPLALQKVLPQLKTNVGFPILVVQHMPKDFTRDFAERLNRLSKIEVREAEDGDRLKPGLALLAPGGKQMELEANRTIKIRATRHKELYKPSADITFTSVAHRFMGRVLAIVMTGMGADGRFGVKILKSKGARIWVQDEQSCTIYGMPKAVADAGLADQIIGLDEIGKRFREM